jgi:non-ribosomal peptide synthetase component E (peptide arylation enzyme)
MVDSAAPRVPPNALAALLPSARDHPDRIALQNHSDSVRLSGTDLVRINTRVAGGLAKLGVQRRDTVALLMGNP